MSARIVFDLDGTLIDSAPDICAIAADLLRAEGMAPLTLDETRGFVGAGAAVFVARMRVARGLHDDAQDRQLDAFLARYEDAVTLTLPYPGVAEALTRLGAAGHRLGICTNKPERPARAVLRHLGLDHHFPVLVGGDSLPLRKPDPAPLVAALAGLGGGPCLFVGDSGIDAETARRAGVPFALFTEGYRHDPIESVPHAAAFADFATLPEVAAAILAEGGKAAPA